MSRFVCVLLLILLTISVSGQKNDTITKKSSLSFVPFPAVSYDSDLGFQYGLIGSLNYYNQKAIPPDYTWTLYAEWSRYTKGSGTNQLFFDSKYILPYGLRITADISFLTEQALNFYGFNGFQSAYFPEIEDDENTAKYISRMYYRHQQELTRMSFDFQGKIYGKKFNWLAGFGRYVSKVSTVDIEKLNKGKQEEDKLPDVPTLYDKYVEYGFIPKEEADGGSLNTLKLGFVYDSRDNEQNTHKGLWLEAIAMTAPSFLANNESVYTKLALTWRHYIPLMPDRLTFAYRLGWQGTIDGKAPFYMQPFMINSFPKTTNNNGLGGGKSLRGVLRNRVVGDAFVFSNMELRYDLTHFNIFNFDVYLNISGFTDIGVVTKPVEFQKSLPDEAVYSEFFDEEKDKPHITYGAGLHIDLERNLMLAIDYGVPVDKRDGTSGLYIGIGFLF